MGSDYHLAMRFMGGGGGGYKTLCTIFAKLQRFLVGCIPPEIIP